MSLPGREILWALALLSCLAGRLSGHEPVPTLRIGFQDLLPYGHVTVDGRVTGLANDLLREIAGRAGRIPVFRAFARPEDGLAALARGEIDVIATVSGGGIGVGPADRGPAGAGGARAAAVPARVPFARFGLGLYAVATGPPAGAARTRIGVIRGSPAEGRAAALAAGALASSGLVDGETAGGGTAPRVMPFASGAALLRALAVGEVGTALLSEGSFRHHVAAFGAETRFRRLGPDLAAGSMVFSVRPALAEILSEHLATLRETGMAARLEDEWTPGPPPFWTMRRLAFAVLAGGAMAGVALFVYSRWVLGKELERRLRERTRSLFTSLRMLDAAFASFPDSAQILDPDGRMRHGNRSVQALLGYGDGATLAEARARGLEIHDLLNDAPMREADRPLLRARRGERVINHPVRARDADGRDHYLQVSAMPVDDAPEGRHLVLLLARDITAEREARYAAEAADRAKTQFFAMVSHEIRTPLNAIMGMLELIARGDVPERYRHMARSGLDASEQLFELLSNVIDSARMESGKLDIHKKPCMLFLLVDQWEGVARALLQKRGKPLGIAVQRKFGQTEVVSIDASRVSQIVQNLIDNALKFTDRGGITLSVAARSGEGRPGRMLVVSVADSGIGIPAAMAGEIFGRFVQAGPGVERGAAGAGLGLSISWQLAHRMGGSLTVDSKEGEGACFTLTVPA